MHEGGRSIDGRVVESITISPATIWEGAQPPAGRASIGEGRHVRSAGRPTISTQYPNAIVVATDPPRQEGVPVPNTETVRDHDDHDARAQKVLRPQRGWHLSRLYR